LNVQIFVNLKSQINTHRERDSNRVTETATLYKIYANKVTNAAIESFHFKCKLIKSTYTNKNTNIYIYNNYMKHI